ncbi:Hypothetical_protein [Hexamita inflata]|uniref:Hypothetical_protein n=1 Tax=Hexamita inflata TaxID=28002 RepID=A0AA86PWD4_9EUKA|nr:Hypothetical protein HINF_LOCUS32982 [Hexamita inflata]
MNFNCGTTQLVNAKRLEAVRFLFRRRGYSITQYCQIFLQGICLTITSFGSLLFGTYFSSSFGFSSFSAGLFYLEGLTEREECSDVLSICFQFSSYLLSLMDFYVASSGYLSNMLDC